MPDLHDDIADYIKEQSECSLEYGSDDQLRLKLGEITVTYGRDMNPAEILSEMQEIYQTYAESLHTNINNALYEFVHRSKSTFN